jgi:hypothetical protein
MFAIIMPFLIYWLVMFVLSYIAVEIGQDQLYDAVTPMAGLKVAGGSFLLAVMLTTFHPTFDSMFTNNLASTAFQALVWIGVFILIYQFHPWHGLAIALPIMLMCSGFATMGVDSVMKPRVTLRAASTLSTSKAVRRTATAPPAPPVPEAKK